MRSTWKSVLSGTPHYHLCRHFGAAVVYMNLPIEEVPVHLSKLDDHDLELSLAYGMAVGYNLLFCSKSRACGDLEQTLTTSKNRCSRFWVCGDLGDLGRTLVGLTMSDGLLYSGSQIGDGLNRVRRTMSDGLGLH